MLLKFGESTRSSPMFISQIRLCAFLLTENIKFRPDSIKLICFVPRFTYVNHHNEVKYKHALQKLSRLSYLIVWFNQMTLDTVIAETTNEEDIIVGLKM
jgi:hypothetical protein